MGRHRFRLADMLPHSWLHRLKAKTTPTPTNPTPSSSSSSPPPPRPPPPPTRQHPINHGRPSYYIPSNPELYSPLHPKAFDTKFLQADPPRKPKNKTKKKIHSTRPPLKPLCPSLKNLDWDPTAEEAPPNLPPILTKPKREEDTTTGKQEEEPRSPCKRSSSAALGGGAHRGLKVRSNSPRIVARARRGGHGGARKALGGSVPIVKASADPRRDFRESMVEMIVENEMRGGEEMEELLACYLTLNSKEYHDVIVEVFQQIWLDLAASRLSPD